MYAHISISYIEASVVIRIPLKYGSPFGLFLPQRVVLFWVSSLHFGRSLVVASRKQQPSAKNSLLRRVQRQTSSMQFILLTSGHRILLCVRNPIFDVEATHA